MKDLASAIDTLFNFLIFISIASGFSMATILIVVRNEANDLTEKITTPKQFELSGKTYRCFHFPEVKE